MKLYRKFVAEIAKKLSPTNKDSKVDKNYSVSGDQYSIDPGDTAAENGKKGPDSSKSHGNVAPKNGEHVSPKQGSSPAPSKVLSKLAKSIKKTPLRKGDKAAGEKAPIKSTKAPIKEFYNTDAAKTVSTATEGSYDPFDSKKHKVFAKVSYLKQQDGSSTRHVSMFHSTSKEDALVKLGQQNPYYLDQNTKIKELDKDHPAHQKYVAVQKQRADNEKMIDHSTVKHLVRKHSFKHFGKPIDPDKITEEKKD
jgi:hypothetical protein